MSESKKNQPEAKATRIKLSDVARESGVHYSTVSRVLRPGSKGKISKEVAERVRAIAEKLGYQPNSVAASMRTKSTRTIGFIVHDLSDPIYPPILNGIERVLSPQGYSVLVGNTGYNIDVEMAIVNRMSSRQIDGIFLGTTRLKDPVVDRCLQLGIPLVSVLRQNQHNKVPAVVSDCFNGMQHLTEYILQAGYRDIAVIHASQNLSTGRERLQGILTVLEQWGITLPPSRLISVNRMSIDEGENQTKSLLYATSRRPEVIMCVNDLVAIGAIRACRGLGLRIPDDIAISGYNDIPLTDMIEPPLTTVQMKLDEIGQKAAEMMLDQLNSVDYSAQTIKTFVELRRRSSVGQRNKSY